MPGTVAIDQDFLRSVTQGLHKLAQPLTLINGYIELSIDRESSDASHELMEKLLQQSHRASSIAQFVAQLARYQIPSEDVKDVLVSEVLKGAIGDISRILDDAQVTLKFRNSGTERPVRISPLRLREVLFQLIDTIRTASFSGDEIRLDLVAESDRLTLLIFRECGFSRKSPDSEFDDYSPSKRALALSRSLLVGAGGSFAGTLEPLFIRAEFPMK